MSNKPDSDHWLVRPKAIALLWKVLIVVLALTGADEGLIKRVLRQFPAGESRNLQRRMRDLGPIQISDVERAQRSIALLAAQLAAGDVIRIPQARRFAVAA